MRFQDLGLVVLACGLCACGTVEGASFVRTEPLGSEAGSGGRAGGSAGQAAGSGGAAARGAAGSAGGTIERKLPKECQFWPPKDLQDEAELVQTINALRERPPQYCRDRDPWPLMALEINPVLQCIARRRVVLTPPSGRSGMTTFYRGPAVANDLWPGTVWEIAADPAETWQELLQGAMDADRRVICEDLRDREATQIGVAHFENVWAIEISVTPRNSPAHSGPQPGDH